MPAITLRELSIGFRGPPLLDGVSCLIEPGDRIGLLGRNGSGKSTLMKLLMGEVEPDAGQVVLAPGLRIARLEQEVPRSQTGTVREVVADAFGDSVHDHDHSWKHEHQLEKILENMQLDPTLRFEALSSGMKRRVLLARALVSSPDVLLLDEPTNHLDIDSIGWMEEHLARWNGTLLFVTHDRTFLRKLATRILEIDRGKLFDWTCDYDTFLVRKEQALAAEEKQNALFDRKLAEEEVWIRQGVKARRTRNEGRVRALEAMRRTRQDRREQQGKVQLQIQESQPSGQLVAEAKEVSFAYDGRPIMNRFSTTIMRGDKIGVIGRNGAGKTTLLRVLLGQLQPQAGSVKLGTNLKIAYFDQLRQQLKEDATVQENVGDGYDTIKTDQGNRHIIGYLQDFLFTPERARSLVKVLSGGERNRVLLAKLFAKPANVIVLDEPTNDLDAETLEMLESRLVDFDGTVLLVSHDRSFLNNVVTSTIVFEEDGVREYVGGYDDWQRQRKLANSSAGGSKGKSSANDKSTGTSAAASANAPLKKKLSFKEKQELDALPKLIATLESSIAKAHEKIAEPTFYQRPSGEIATEMDALRKLETQLEAAYVRWSELEG